MASNAPDRIYYLKKTVPKDPNCTMLSIERIGSERLSGPKCGVAIVSGVERGGSLREDYLKGYIDYSKANSVGSRGVTKNYLLEEGNIYHVMAPESWKRSDNYFCRIENCAITRMSIAEVFRWLTKKYR